MIGKEIIENEPIPSAKVKQILDEFSEEHELNYEQNLTLNHLSRFKKYSVEDTEEIMEKLQEAFPNLRARVLVHIVDLVPQDLADLRLIFAKEPYQPSKEEAGIAVAVHVVPTLRTVGFLRKTTTQYTDTIGHTFNAYAEEFAVSIVANALRFQLEGMCQFVA